MHFNFTVWVLSSHMWPSGRCVGQCKYRTFPSPPTCMGWCCRTPGASNSGWFGDGSASVWDCPVCCRMWSSIPGLYPLGSSSTSLSCTCSVTTEHLSRHSQVFPGWGGRFTPLPHKCSRLFSPYCFQFFFTYFLDLCSVNPEIIASWTRFRNGWCVTQAIQIFTNVCWLWWRPEQRWAFLWRPAPCYSSSLFQKHCCLGTSPDNMCFSLAFQLGYVKPLSICQQAIRCPNLCLF